MLYASRCAVDENAETIEAPAVDFIETTADIVSAYVANNPVRPADLPELLSSVHAALSRLSHGGATAAAPVEKLTSAQIRKSITHDALISFEDGKPYKTLHRHLTIRSLTPDAYREKWGLPRNYPMTATSYSEQRAALAKSLGLGHQRRKAVPKSAAVADSVSEKPKRGGRPRKG